MLGLNALAVHSSVLPLAAAHFAIEYPYWRGDSTANGASQLVWPCANVPQTPTTEANRTLWPGTGGSLRLHTEHAWALTYVNVGFPAAASDHPTSDNAVTNFNISLLAGFNQTGNGTVCLPQLGAGPLADMIAQSGPLSGDNATIQVVQVDPTGVAYYNCADIEFFSWANRLPGDECKNSTGVGGAMVQDANATAVKPGKTTAGSAASASARVSPNSAAAGRVSTSMPAAAVLMAMGVLFALERA